MFAIHKREILLPLWIWLGCSTLLTRLKERDQDDYENRDVRYQDA